MTDSAKGPGAGYIYQYERALLLLSNLKEAKEYISIEMVDDVARHNDKNVLLAIQAKHSIQQNSSSFQNTSLALWRTLELWIQKLESGVYNSNTKFVCSTNRAVTKDSLLNKFKTQTLDVSIVLIEQLYNKQKEKLDNTKNGKSIKKIIGLIEYVLDKQEYLKTIIENLEIETETSIKEAFFNSTHLNSTDITELQRENVYQTLYGWLVCKCGAFWQENREAIFTKEEFDTRFNRTMNNSSIINAIFRKKSDIIKNHDILLDNHKKALFVKQIEDIPRNKSAKERIINDAIIDFICSEIELNEIIQTGDFTKEDFNEFSQQCYKKWQDSTDSILLYDIEEYTEKEKNEIALEVFNTIMGQLELNFEEGHSFSESTKYIQNGTFLKLSDIPEIGWHPEWETKYKK